MEISRQMSDRVAWSFENVTGRIGAAPQINRANMVAEYGEEETNNIVRVVQKLIDMTNVIEKEIDWTKHDLRYGQNYMERRLQEEISGLTQPAANWIARYFSYQMK